MKLITDYREVKKAQKGFDYAKVVKVEGGWLLFETLIEYYTWKKQK